MILVWVYIRLRNAPQVTTPDAVVANPTSSMGLHQHVIEMFPVSIYAEDQSGELLAECTICIENFLNGQQIRTLSYSHSFHTYLY